VYILAAGNTVRVTSERRRDEIPVDVSDHGRGTRSTRSSRLERPAGDLRPPQRGLPAVDHHARPCGDAILADCLDERLRADAELDAHKIAGSLGLFGLARASKFATELELRFVAGHRTVVTSDAHLPELVCALRAEIRGPGR
jgi:hypothetical protein